MYKDKAKQKEAVRNAVAKHRKGITSKGITGQGITFEGTRGGLSLHSGPTVCFNNGCYIHVNKLVDPKSRKLLTYLSENLKYPDSVRVGMNGPSITDVKKLLEVTA